jgi:hypothetical protein
MIVAVLDQPDRFIETKSELLGVLMCTVIGETLTRTLRIPIPALTMFDILDYSPSGE